MILIGLGNRARHGKDTAGRAILDYAHTLGLPTLHISWADALYEEVNRFLENIKKNNVPLETALDVGITETKHETDTSFYKQIYFPEWVKPTPDAEVSERAPHGKHTKLLQWWGTDYRRAQNANYWIDKGVAVIKKFEENAPYGVVVVPDTRFFNEAQAIRALGGYTLRVTRIEDTGYPYIDATRDPTHPSETELESYNWDFRIVSKNPKLTEKLAVATFEFIREQRGT